MLPQGSAVWIRTDRGAKTFRTTKKGGPQWSSVYRRVTKNAETGEVVADELVRNLTEKQLHRMLAHPTNLLTELHYALEATVSAEEDECVDLDPEDPEEEIDLDPDPPAEETVEQLLPAERDYLTELAWDGPVEQDDTRVREVGTSTKPRDNPQPAAVTEEEMLTELQDWEEHLRMGHQPKRKDCSTCQQADGPIEVHRSRKTEVTSGRTLHLDLAGPYETSELNAAK